ncbi:unnamed protein product [Phytophthora fragariaefolia]|uniref:Unnamed protein product n=1 Tax=Phytophthora fragariaefolia TaxID=1490495 RepID=A0A9W7D1Z0_9STRA|nr:unnamed protein product [Phytophthora fragariaefolia]
MTYQSAQQQQQESGTIMYGGEESKQGVAFAAVPPCADDEEDQACGQEDYDSRQAVDSGGGRHDYNSTDSGEEKYENGCEASRATETDDAEQDPTHMITVAQWQPRMVS